jgi:acyl carrier protein
MARTAGDIAQAVERFLRTEFRIPDRDGSFHRDAHLYDSGFVDSAGVVELIAFLESTFDVQLPDEDIFSDEFTTINGISGVVYRRLNGSPPRGVPVDEAQEAEGLRATGDSTALGGRTRPVG